MDQIATDPQVGLDDKKGMIEMLRRFEQQAEDGGSGPGLGHEGELEEGDDEEEDELEARLRDIDLDDIDSNKLFHLLPQEHRDAFLAAIRHPESDAAKELFDNLQDIEGEGEDSEDVLPTSLPWWERADNLDSAEEDGDDDVDNGVSYAEEPSPIEESSLVGIVPPMGVGNKLVYNALAIWYVSITMVPEYQCADVQSRVHTCASRISPTLARSILPHRLWDKRSGSKEGVFRAIALPIGPEVDTAARERTRRLFEYMGAYSN